MDRYVTRFVDLPEEGKEQGLEEDKEQGLEEVVVVVVPDHLDLADVDDCSFCGQFFLNPGHITSNCEDCEAILAPYLRSIMSLVK